MTVGNWPTGCFATAEIWELPQKDLSVQKEENNRLGLRDGTQKLSADLMNDIFSYRNLFFPKGAGTSEPFSVSATALPQFWVAGRCEKHTHSGFLWHAGLRI